MTTFFLVGMAFGVVVATVFWVFQIKRLGGNVEVMVHQIYHLGIGVFVFDTADELAAYINANKLQRHEYITSVVPACEVIRSLQKALAEWEKDFAEVDPLQS